MTEAKVLVTGSAGHLGEALCRVLRGRGHQVTGLDVLASPSTTVTGSITEDVAPVPRNIYGVTKTAAENLCEIIQRDRGLPVVVLRTAAPGVVRRLFGDYEAEYRRRGWPMFPGIGRVYVNAKARAELGWTPRYGFREVLDALREGRDFRSLLAREVGRKAYHAESTGIYTVR